MTWIYQHRKVLRVMILALLSLALTGPWLFDLINVPSQYDCHAPNVRLYGDFCGVPMSGIKFLSWIVFGFIYASKELGSGSMVFVDWGREFLLSLLLFLILLPFFSTLILILSGDRRGLQVFSVVAWGLALGLCLLLSISNYPELFWALWGIWLYIGVAAGALILELLVFVGGRRTLGSGD